MCRSIKTLRSSEGLPDEEEIEAAALQFVRKISGYRRPSRRNEEAFNQAVREIGASSKRLLETLVVSPAANPRARQTAV
jgi:hypothetical protein